MVTVVYTFVGAALGFGILHPVTMVIYIMTLKCKDDDGFERHLMQYVGEHLAPHLAPYVHIMFHTIGGSRVCRVAVEAAHEPVYVREGGDKQFYIRNGNGTCKLDVEEAFKYIVDHWRDS